jgi:hypothetical protein
MVVKVSGSFRHALTLGAETSPSKDGNRSPGELGLTPAAATWSTRCMSGSDLRTGILSVVD